jgi:hypothetical protein
MTPVLRNLAGANAELAPRRRPLYTKPEALAFAARVLATADGSTLTRLRAAALEIKGGNEAEGFRLLATS